MYSLSKSSFGSDIVIKDNGDGTFTSFSDDAANTDWQAYQAWLAEGNTPNPYVQPPPAPDPTVEEKLASVGLTISDLKAALGL